MYIYTRTELPEIFQRIYSELFEYEKRYSAMWMIFTWRVKRIRVSRKLFKLLKLTYEYKWVNPTKSQHIRNGGFFFFFLLLCAYIYFVQAYDRTYFKSNGFSRDILRIISIRKWFVWRAFFKSDIVVQTKYAQYNWIKFRNKFFSMYRRRINHSRK